MIKAMFVSNKLPGSWLISWGTKREGQEISETPSHVAFLFFDTIVIDSNLASGVKETTYAKTLKKYNIVKEVDLNVSEEESYRYLEKARSQIIGSKYDWPAILYFSWRVVLHKFGVPFPKKNRMNFKNMYFCTEVMSIITGERYGIVSPNDLMLKLIENDYKIVTKEFE